MNLKLKITEYPDTPPLADEREYQSGKLGISVMRLPADAAERFGLPNSTQAVVVVNVFPAGPSARKLQAGDIIAEMDKKPIKSLHDFAQAESDADIGKGILLLIQRGQRRFYDVVRQQ